MHKDNNDITFVQPVYRPSRVKKTRCKKFLEWFLPFLAGALAYIFFRVLCKCL